MPSEAEDLATARNSWKRRKQWAIGLHAWIIQDGNYPDFERGQQVTFAVEFWGGNLTRDEPGPASIEFVQGSIYSLKAPVEAVFDDVWVINCGIAVYQDRAAPAGIVPGDRVCGHVELGVDPFMYFEQLSAQPGMPSLIYSWVIDRISRETTPYIQVGPRTWQRDPDRVGYEDVDQTDAWGDDRGLASYILHCILLDIPPSHKRGPR